MGLDTNGVRFLLEACQDGVVFEDCVTLGRQGMYLTKNQLLRVFQKLSIEIDDPTATRLLLGPDGKGYAESFLDYCGAKTIGSIDYSHYEGATFVHDMNIEIGPELKSRFSCLIDGGTLEHVFNYPVAISNCMKMIKQGGHFLSITPCNNFMGHGFYQFSPELLWGLFSEQNGFTVERMYIFESTPHACWYSVANPKLIQSRVKLCNTKQTFLLVQARKVAEMELRNVTPQQSDYIDLWQGAPATPLVSSESRVRKIVNTIKSVLPNWMMVCLRPITNIMRAPFRNPFPEPYYKKYK